MTLRKPFTLMHEDTCVPLPILGGTEPRQPANIVIQSPNRFKSHASFHAESGASSADVETSTRHTRAPPLDNPRVWRPAAEVRRPSRADRAALPRRSLAPFGIAAHQFPR